MKVRAPAKLILSGEHAVVYGKPALAVAINRYAEVEAIPHLAPFISFDFGDLAYQEALRFASLERLKERIRQKYRRFLQGEFNIRQVLKKPVELAQVALSLFFEMRNLSPTQGLKIKVESDIPMGCGLGSSAAIILAVLYAIAGQAGFAPAKDELFRLALEVENLQHGRSSGLDLQVSQRGGCLWMEEGAVFARPKPTLPFYLVNTGKPRSSTGDCVSAASPIFQNTALADDFSAVTRAMDQALRVASQPAFYEAIRSNHALLVRLGVVPQTVQRFVSQLEEAGGAAKICGAGSVSGEQAGVLLVATDDLKALTEHCSLYRYTLLPASIEERGVHLVD